jgi:hypothetical protein
MSPNGSIDTVPLYYALEFEEKELLLQNPQATGVQ